MDNRLGIAAEHHATAPLAQAAGAAVRWRAVGLIGSKLLGVLRSFVLAWLIVPDDFGLFALAVLPLDTLLSASDVGMLPALVQSQNVDESDYAVAWTIGLLRALLVGLALIAAAPLVARLLGDARATSMIQLIALRPLLVALNSVQLARLERQLQFRAPAVVGLVTAAVHTVVTLALARSAGAWALAYGTLGGALAGVMASYWQAPGRPRVALDARRAASLLRFGRWVLIAGLIAMAGEWILVAAITRTAGTAALGRYALAASIALTPASMFGSLIGGVAFAAHARAASDARQSARVFRTSLIAMLVPVVPSYALLFALAPELVSHALDARWAGLGPAIRLLAIAGVLGLVFDASTSLLAGVGRPRASALLSVAYTGVVALLAWSLTQNFGIEGAAAARVSAEVALICVALILVGQVVRHPSSGLGPPAFCIISSAMAGAVCARATLAYSPTAVWLAISGLIGLAAAALMLLTLDRVFGSAIRRDAAFVLSIRGRAA